jgi:hypothetical protein
MKFEETFDFDHPAATMMRMFTDKDYFLAKYERLGGRKPEFVDCQKSDDDFWITVRHALDANKLSFPDMIKKRVGDRIMLRQTDLWDIPKQTGRIDIDIEKTPVDITIDMVLSEQAGKAQLTLKFDIDAQVPLLGSKIEKAIAGPITQRLHRDMELSNQMASDYAAA